MKIHVLGDSISIHYGPFLAAIVQVVATAKRPCLVWIRTTPCSEAVHNTRNVGFHRFAADCAAYNAAADEIMRAAGVPMLDLFTFTRNLGDDAALFCDHVHFHEAIRAQQAAFIAGWVARYASVDIPPRS